eukprot:Lithocolla_globosa_v1_NODE_1294_length_2695_cov_6.288258.p3 type:complete len:116 gc:universal NODE_1294_length_2695_cov_6.288258:795-1142(+)
MSDSPRTRLLGMLAAKGDKGGKSKGAISKTGSVFFVNLKTEKSSPRQRVTSLAETDRPVPMLEDSRYEPNHLHGSQYGISFSHLATFSHESNQNQPIQYRLDDCHDSAANTTLYI